MLERQFPNQVVEFGILKGAPGTHRRTADAADSKWRSEVYRNRLWKGFYETSDRAALGLPILADKPHSTAVSSAPA